MNDNELCQAMIAELKPFFEKNMKGSVIFHTRTGLGQYAGGRTICCIDVNTSKAKPIFRFTINNNVQKGNYVVNNIALDIDNKKYLPLYNKFIKHCSEQSTDSFSLFMKAASYYSEPLKIISKINILPFAKRTLKFGSWKTLMMDKTLHAEVTTPFETFKVYKIAKFIFENNQFYLNDEFHFISFGMDFWFQKNSEQDSLVKMQLHTFATQFNDLHQTQILGSIIRLYNLPHTEVNAFSNEQIMSYYPVLAIEHY
jgi:hypothetical protein